MTAQWVNVVICQLTGLLLSACVTTNYTSYDDASGSTSPLDREVVYHLDRAFYRDPPECVVVLSSRDAIDSRLAAMIEDSLARHLSMKVRRVIDAGERSRLERDLAVDLLEADGRRIFAQLSGCRGFLRWQTLEASEDYVLVF